MPKRTILFSEHGALGGRIIDFAGWEMPVQYEGIIAEHFAVRSNAGIFDISHMGEFFVRGRESAAWLDRMLTNRASALNLSEGHYSLLLNEQGGVIDDLILYRIESEAFLLIVNASKTEEDYAWMTQRLAQGVTLEDMSAGYSAFAVQGPGSEKIFEDVIGGAAPAKNHVRSPRPGWYAAGTGYTGEAGFELFLPNADAVETWRAVQAAGAKPCGLGSRDILRLEMGYPLNGADLLPDRTPLEAGLGVFVDLTKDEFIGKEALVAQKEQGLPTKLCAIRIDEKSPPLRAHYPVFADGRKVSETTSGAHSPSLGFGIAMAYLPAEFSKIGQPVEVEIRNKRYPAKVCKKPFYSRPSQVQK